MSRITREQVDHIAGLARLSLSDDEAQAMVRDLDQILGYVEDLQAVDTTGIAPTAHAIPLETPMRADEAVEAMDPELAVSNAPEGSPTAFVVPNVVEGDEGLLS